MVCVILAAGKNLRLNAGLPKSFLTINGKSLMERHIEQFQKLGVNKFAIITGFHKPALDKNIEEIRKNSEVEIVTIYNEKYELENGYSLYKAKDWINELGCDEFFFTMADHYYDEAFLSDLKNKLDFKNGEYLKLVVDKPGTHNHHIDLEDVTKVDATTEIKNIGKELTNYNYYDTGLFFVKSKIFDTLDEIAKGETKLSISNMVTKLAEEGKTKVEEVIGFYWNDIDTPEDFKSSKEFLE
ncbi:MAG: NTP transferase domain-containing protein [Reichenbachiella sp.]